MESLTEEDARVALSRWLQSIGIDPSQVRFELTFRIHAGRLTRDIDGRPIARDGTIRPRCDVLIMADDRPIAIAEVKKPGTAFDADDREQGLSYAHMTSPPTPLVLLTDGLHSEMLIASSGQPYNPEVVKDLIAWHKLPADIAPSPDDLLDALRWFLRLDRRNVTEFCRAQQEFRAEGLIAPEQATPNEALGRYKHLRKAYIERERANAALDAFMAQDESSVLPILSAAGVGKTSFMLDRCCSISKTHLVFFLNGVKLTQAPLAAIREDLRWEGISVNRRPKLTLYRRPILTL